MKRSKAIEKLANRLLETQLAAWANCEAAGFLEELAESDAEELMEFIEDELGMMPPSQDIIDESGMVSSLYTYDCFCGGDYNVVEIEDFCKWDEEDED